MKQSRTQFVPTRVGQVALEITGDGPPLVLLHSVAHDRHDYDAVVPTLSKTFRTIAVDWPGHGDSEMWREPASASAGGLFDALEDVVDALGIREAVFMGSSIGGTASLRLSARRPSLVRGLVIVDSAGFAGSSALVSAACWIQGREIVRRWTGIAFARFYLKVPGPGVDAVLARIEAARRRPGFIEMEAAMWRSFGTKSVDLTSLAPSIKSPTLIVWGKKDPVIRASAEGKKMRRHLPHADYVELDTGHVPFVERPEAFLEAVLPFLKTLSRPAIEIAPQDPSSGPICT